MTDPTRLREEGSELDRSLLESAKLDEPSEGAEARALAALGLTTAASTAPGAMTTTKSWTALHLAAIAKVTGALLVIAGIAVIAFRANRSTGTHAATATSISTPTPTPTPTPSPSPSPSPNPTPSPSPTPTPNPNPTPSTVPSTKSPALQKPASEVEWIDRAQAALAHDPARALAIVDDYRARPGPHGFDEEASAIAAEAAQRSGDHARATREANAFLAKYPSSAYRDRVQAVIDNP